MFQLFFGGSFFEPFICVPYWKYWKIPSPPTQYKKFNGLIVELVMMALGFFGGIFSENVIITDVSGNYDSVLKFKFQKQQRALSVLVSFELELGCFSLSIKFSLLYIVLHLLFHNAATVPDCQSMYSPQPKNILQHHMVFLNDQKQLVTFYYVYTASYIMLFKYLCASTSTSFDLQAETRALFFPGMKKT